MTKNAVRNEQNVLGGKYVFVKETNSLWNAVRNLWKKEELENKEI